MSKLFIYSNSFTAMTIMRQMQFVLNIKIDEILLLKENHRQNESMLSKLYGFDVKVFSDIDECIDKSDYIFVIKDSNMPIKCIMYVVEKSIKLRKLCVEIVNPWSEDLLSDKEIDSSTALNFKNHPVILTIGLGVSSQQYFTEILINEIFAKNKVKIKQYFSPQTYYFLNQLNNHGIVNKVISDQLQEVKDFSVVVCSINIGVDFNNIVNYVNAIKRIKPDFVILQAGIRFCEYDTAKQMLKYGCSSSLDLIIKSHYNNVTLDDVKIYYCANQIVEDNFINDIEKGNLKEKLEMEIITKLSLPKGVSRI